MQNKLFCADINGYFTLVPITSTIIIIIIVIYNITISGFPDVTSNLFKFRLLDDTLGLHISESTVSISYKFC
jgi:hypothetical protein